MYEYTNSIHHLHVHIKFICYEMIILSNNPNWGYLQIFQKSR